MPTPRQGYTNKDGGKVPSVTTILGRFKESGALLKWAYTTGREHGNLEARGKECPAGLYEVSGKAADIGTAGHAMVECHIKGENPKAALAYIALNDDDRLKAESSFTAYLNWAGMSKLVIVEQEMPMVSEVYQFAGTPDAIGLVNGQLSLVDWKTSNAVYADYLLQIAAYKWLWEENNPDRPLTGGFHLCRFSKDFGDFSHHYYSELDNAWEMFKHLRAAFTYDKELRKRTA